MRVDKFLKASRIMKRRTIANELAANQRVEINGRVVKPGKEVMPGEIVGVTFGSRKIEFRVLSTEEPKKKKDASEMYEIVGEYKVKEDNLEGSQAL